VIAARAGSSANRAGRHVRLLLLGMSGRAVERWSRRSVPASRGPVVRRSHRAERIERGRVRGARHDAVRRARGCHGSCRCPVLPGSAPIGARRPRPGSPHRRDIPMSCTIVLVHGAFAESASWDGAIDPLVAEGHSVVAVANPLRGVAADAAAVSDVVRTIDGPIVLVAHSHGGAVISNVDPRRRRHHRSGLRRRLRAGAGARAASASRRCSRAACSASRRHGRCRAATRRPTCTSRRRASTRSSARTSQRRGRR
jgi:hypothetical protein